MHMHTAKIFVYRAPQLMFFGLYLRTCIPCRQISPPGYYATYRHTAYEMQVDVCWPNKCKCMHQVDAKMNGLAQIKCSV
jgi:hypothetical protein